MSVDARCSFQTTYRDYKKEDFVPFKCNRKPHDGGTKCIFHDEDYLASNENYQQRRSTVIEELRKIVIDRVRNRQPLLCIGYYLPSYMFSLFCKQFSIPLYFTKSTFRGVVDFGEIEFCEDVLFDEVKFDGPAYFGSNTKFKRNAYFS
jgi:hypothetical protein